MCFVLFLLAQGFQTTTGFITRRQDPDNNTQVPGQCFSENRSVATIQWVFFVGQTFSQTTIYCITENFRWLNFCGSKFRKPFIDIHQAHSKLAIVYTRDFHNGDLCQVVQYYG